MRKLTFFILIICISIFTFGCIKDVDEIIATKNEISVEVGDEFTLPIIANEKVILAYSFSRNDIVSLTNNTFKAINEGEVIITCYNESNKNNKVQIKVVANIPRKINTTQTSISLSITEEVTLPLELTNLTHNDLAYDLSNDDTITVSQGFKIHGRKKGQVTLTVFYVDNPDIKVEFEITVNNLKYVKILLNPINLQVKDNYNIPIELVELTYDDIDITVVDEEIITIEDNIIKALNVGSTNIIIKNKSNAIVLANLTVNVEKRDYSIYEYEYWVENLDPKYNKDDIILSLDEINQINLTILENYNNTKVMDIINQPTTRTKEYVLNLINSYSHFDRYVVYNDETITFATLTEKQQILNNRNLDSIPDTISITYGIITDFAAVRSYPTNFYSQGYLLDRFQETSFNVGEGVLIYHYSLDGKWAFVQGRNYNGWVEVKNIALCTYDEFKSFLQDPKFIIVISERLNVLGVDVRMGQRIPYKWKNDDYYSLTFPTRNSNGYLELKSALIKNDENVNEGYLDYTIENLAKQAVKLMGFDYSWGDKFIDGRDCSSTINSIFNCFGFMMPRNTSNQSNIPSYSTKVTNITHNQFKDNYRIGTLFFTPTHVLMYIGDDENGIPYFFHNTNSGTPHCRVDKVIQYLPDVIAITTLFN